MFALVPVPEGTGLSTLLKDLLCCGADALVAPVRLGPSLVPGLGGVGAFGWLAFPFGSPHFHQWPASLSSAQARAQRTCRSVPPPRPSPFQCFPRPVSAKDHDVGCSLPVEGVYIGKERKKEHNVTDLSCRPSVARLNSSQAPLCGVSPATGISTSPFETHHLVEPLSPPTLG